MDLSNYDNEINIITEKYAIPSIKYQVNLNMVSMLIWMLTDKVDVVYYLCVINIVHNEWN